MLTDIDFIFYQKIIMSSFFYFLLFCLSLYTKKKKIIDNVSPSTRRMTTFDIKPINIRHLIADKNHI